MIKYERSKKLMYDILKSKELSKYKTEEKLKDKYDVNHKILHNTPSLSLPSSPVISDI
jgi:hypothetical protein